VQIAADHLDGEANVWWQWILHKNHGEHMRWRDFEKELITRFGSSDYLDYDEALSRIKQSGSLREYQKEFERIASRVRDWPESALVGTFVGGLKAELAAEVRLDRPGSMRAAMDLARLHEDHLVAVRKARPSDVRTETKRTHAAIEEQAARTENKPLGDTVRTTSHIRRHTDDEMQRRREKGLCYSCNEKFTPGHKCKGKEVFLLEIEEGYEEEKPQEESLWHMVKSKKRGPKMITFTTEIRGKFVEVLVDSRSTLNFIDEELSKEIEIPFTKVKPFGVKVANGETLRRDILFKGVKMEAQGQNMRVDLYALPLKATDIVLGCQWLETLGPITTDYWKGTMEFGRSSKRVKFRTEDPGESPDEDEEDGRVRKLNFLILGDKERLEEEGNDTEVEVSACEVSGIGKLKCERGASDLDAHGWANKRRTRVATGARGCASILLYSDKISDRCEYPSILVSIMSIVLSIFVYIFFYVVADTAISTTLTVFKSFQQEKVETQTGYYIEYNSYYHDVARVVPTCAPNAFRVLAAQAPRVPATVRAPITYGASYCVRCCTRRLPRPRASIVSCTSPCACCVARHSPVRGLLTRVPSAPWRYTPERQRVPIDLRPHPPIARPFGSTVGRAPPFIISLRPSARIMGRCAPLAHEPIAVAPLVGDRHS
ncbi:Unknown protein, partial [Striga hermonthica]